MIKCRVCGKVLTDEERGNGHICVPCYNAEQNYKRKNTPPRELQFNYGKPWTMKDIKYLQTYGDTDSLEELGYALGRSVGSIAQKKSELSKHKKKPEHWQITSFYVKPKHKKCSRCTNIYPANKQHFNTDNGKKDKLSYMCKKCYSAVYKTRKANQRKAI